MTIEKLAEIVNQQWNFGTPFRRTAKEWQAFCESTAQAIATAVLAEPTSDEAVRFAKEYETNIQNREGFQATPAAQAGLKLFLSDRLASLTQSKQPAADASKADVSEDEELVRNLMSVSEEVGELSQEILRLRFGNDKEKHAAALREELVQVAAVAVAWLECIDRNALPHLQRGVTK